ncbi:MAG: DUF4173 domain-containing protein [Fimbriimonadales bacterium]|nr:DUF4173 domain-containing protein [Fimbriimonadales bacterium]
MAEAQPLEQAAPVAEARTRAALAALIGAVLLGILGERLFYLAGLGLNLPLWSLLTLAGWLFVARAARFAPSRSQIALVAVAWLFTLLVTWRDSPTLNVLAILTALLMIGLAAYRWARGLMRGSVLEYCLLMPLHLLVLLIGGLLVLALSDVRWSLLGNLRPMRGARLALTGLLLALPFLLLFGALFVSADAVFREILRDLFDFDGQRLLLIVFFAWLAGSLLRMLLWHEEELTSLNNEPITPRVGAAEIGVALGLINLLFASFVAVQIRYLFGGASLVQVTPDLTYAEYARQGFGQLVAASLFVLPMLLLFDWLTNRESRVARCTFQAMAVLLIALLGVVMASAWHRLLLYQQAYGLTELRVYAAASMVWLGLTLLWFLATVLPGRRERFSFGATMLLAVTVIGLHLLNPDALIARVNLTRALQNKPLDVTYLTSLSADSLPVILELTPQLPEPEQAIIRERLRRHSVLKAAGDWRDWNWSRVEGRRLLKGLQGLHEAPSTEHFQRGGLLPEPLYLQPEAVQHLAAIDPR